MAAHNYLGCELDSIRSRNFLLEGSVYDLIILPLRNVVLFPGETVPLRIRDRNYISALGDMMKQDSAGANFHGGLTSIHLGLVNLGNEVITTGSIGTTSEIRAQKFISQRRNHHRNRHHNHNHSNNLNISDDMVMFHNEPIQESITNEIILRVKGCHRFKLLSPAIKVAGVYIAKVLILSEIYPRFDCVNPALNPFPKWVRFSFFPHFFPFYSLPLLLPCIHCMFS